MSMGENIKKARKNKGLTSKELADMLGLAYVTIRYYETDRRLPSIPQLVRMADIFECTTDYLLDRAENKTVEVDNTSNNKLRGFENNPEISNAIANLINSTANLLDSVSADTLKKD